MDDASLDDFLSDGDESEAGDGDPDPAAPSPDTAPEDEGDETDAPAVDTTDVEPAVSTYAWRSDATACAACGEQVERRWRDDGRLVCADCKDW